LAAAQDKARREADMNAADIRLKNANAAYAEARPDIDAQKRAEADRTRVRNAVLANFRLLKNQKLDVDNPAHLRLLRRAADVNVEVDPDEWNAAIDAGRAVPFDYIDDDAPTVKRRGVFDRSTGEVHPLDHNGAPITTGYVAPTHADTEMTATQEHTDADRDASRGEQHRHNVVTEGQGSERIGQGAERIGIARENQQLRGQPTANTTNTRLARAADLARKLEEEKTRAAHPPSFNPATPEYQRAYTARHLDLARGFAQQIKDGYSDVYEAGDGDGGYPYAKPKTLPNARPQAGGAQLRGAYAGQRFSRAQLPEIRKRLGVSSDEEAQRYVESQGGVIY
jgi:hypothetical protein